MDERFREDKGQKHIDRLDFISDQLNQSDSESSEIRFDLYQQENDLNEAAKSFNLSFAILLLVLLAILIKGYIQEGGLVYYVLPMVIIIGYLFYYRISIKSAHDKLELLKPKLPYSDESKEHQISVLNYQKSSSQLKLSYAQLIRNFYTAFFPVLLYYVKDLFFNHDTSSIQWIIFFVFAVGSGVFWWCHFNQEVSKYTEEINTKQQQINGMLIS